MTEDIRIGDWVFLDDEDEDNRWYHEALQEHYHTEFHKEYLVIHVAFDIIYLRVDGSKFYYNCHISRVRLANHLEETVLWK